MQPGFNPNYVFKYNNSEEGGDDEGAMKGGATGFWQLEGEGAKQQGDGATLLPAQ